MITAILAILSPLLGIIGSLLPNIVRIFEKREEQKYEIELTKLKMDAAALQAEANIDLESIKAIVSEGQSLRTHDSTLDGGQFLNALRSSIRPVVTYIFFGTFILIKVIAMWAMISSGAAVPVIVATVWDVETMALFSTIMAFWFGSRFLEKREDEKNRYVTKN
jgi:hypothetical protein